MLGCLKCHLYLINQVFDSVNVIRFVLFSELATGLKDYEIDGAGPSSVVDIGADLSQQTSLSDPMSPSLEFSDEDSDVYSDVEIN